MNNGNALYDLTLENAAGRNLFREYAPWLPPKTKTPIDSESDAALEALIMSFLIGFPVIRTFFEGKC